MFLAWQFLQKSTVTRGSRTGWFDRKLRVNRAKKKIKNGYFIKHNIYRQLFHRYKNQEKSGIEEEAVFLYQYIGRTLLT